MTKHNIVIGGSGFLGSNLCEKVNICNPDEITILELAEEIIDIAGSRSKLIHNPCQAMTRNRENLIFP